MMDVVMKNGTMTVNGKSFKGSNISVRGNKVYVDGKLQEGELTGNINVVINGDVSLLECQSGNITAQNVGEISTGSGDVRCQNVGGSIRTGSGDVNCTTVVGNIRTGSGDVYYQNKLWGTPV